MKKIILSVVLSASIFGLAACSSNDSDPDTVAKTNVGDITKDDYYNELKNRDGGELLQNLVVVKVLEDKYEVTEKEIDDQIEKFKEEQGENFEMWLMQIGVTDVEDEAFRTQVKSLVLNEKVQYEGIEVTDEELQEKFDELKENNQIEIKASHILVEDEDEAKDIKKKLDDGGDFAELAKEHSVDGSAENGGDIGFFTSQDNLVQEFKDAAYELELDEISEPVKSEFGYHIITITDIPTFEDKKEMVRTAVLQEKVNPEELQEKINTLLKDADIKVEIEEFKDMFQFEDLDKDKAENNSDDKVENDVEDNSKNNTEDNPDANSNDTTNENTDNNSEK